MIPLQYRIHTGRRLNLKNPQRFTEKLQLYKLKYRNPLMLRCTDKYEVRNVVAEMGFGDILIPLVGIYDSTDAIDFESLPLQFVAKTTDGGGGNQVLICRDRRDLDANTFYSTLDGWLKAPKARNAGREWAYENNYPRRIVIEEFISDGKNKDIPDYKFFCFDGEPMYCQVIGNRSTDETIDFYDMEWRHMEFRGLNKACNNADSELPEPWNFDGMKALASKLAAGFPFVRVDLYNTGENIYFGELTFYPASGLGHFTPDCWDNKIGSLMNVPENQLSKIGGGKWLIDRCVCSRVEAESLIDYKFFCFNGKVKMIYVITGRTLGKGAELGIYTPDLEKMDVRRNDELIPTEQVTMPANFDKMTAIAQALSAPFPHVRVDLYNVQGKIYFGELTFYDGSGYMSFTPDSFDFDLGAMWANVTSV